MDNKTPIIVALIGIVAPVTVAVIANWNTLFPRPPVSTTVDRPIPASATTGDAVRGGAKDAVDPGAAAVPPAGPPDPSTGPVSPGASRPAVKQIGGRWADMDDDYRYVFTQTGGAIAYRASEQGADRGGGQGTIIGDVLHYDFSSDGGPGSCIATLADDGDHISGACRRGSETFPVRLQRMPS